MNKIPAFRKIEIIYKLLASKETKALEGFTCKVLSTGEFGLQDNSAHCE